MICPICDKKIEDHKTYGSEHGTEEEHALCKDDHHTYGYEFLYGATAERIGSVEFHSYYSDGKTKREKHTKQLQAVLLIEREAYQKLKGGEDSGPN